MLKLSALLLLVPQLHFSTLFLYVYVFFQQQMLTDPMVMAQQQGYGQVSIPTPTAMIIKQASMSPLVARHMQPSPNPSRRSVVIPSPQIQHHPSAMASPAQSPMLSQRHGASPQPSMRSGFVNVQRPPSFISRQISPLSSPSLIGYQRTQRSPSPLARGPSPLQSPCGSIIRRSPPTSPRTSMRQHSPPSSPRASVRRRSPSPSASPARSPFGGRKIYASPSPPLSPGHASPPLSPKLSRPSPSPSHRSLSPTGPRPASSSPTLSRHSVQLLRDPTPLVRPRMGGNIPLGTVRPSPMGLRGRPVPPPTQNVRPFRASSIRSNRSSALTVDSLHSSPFNSPHMVHRTPLGRRESGRFPPRPVARGRPLMAQQSMKRMSPSSPQPPLKHISHPASPRFSPRLSYQSSPHLPETYLSGPYADSHTERLDQFVTPSSPILSGALQNEAIRQASFTSPLGPERAQGIGMGEMATEYPEPYVPPSPSLSSAMQNQAIRDASYVTQLQKPMSPYEQPVPPSYPALSGALQNQAVREASYASPLPRPHSPYAPSVPSSPLLSGAMRHGQALRGVASYQTPPLNSPYGPTVVTAYDYISEPGPAPLLHDALQNRSSLQNVSSLRSPTMQRHNPYAPVGPHVHSALQQNPNLRQTSYQTPAQLRRSPYRPSPPSSPLLGSALQNPQLMQASYRLPDGALVSPYADSHSSPLLGHALQNQQVRGASYILPDGSVIRVGIKGICHTIVIPYVNIIV